MEGEWRKAASYLDSMQSSKMDTDAVSMSAAIGACGKSSLWQVAVAYLVNSSRRKHHLNAFVGNAVLSACSSATQWQIGLQILLLLPKFHIAADAVTLNTSLSMLHQTNSWQSVVGILALMVDVHLQPTISPLNMVMSCLAKAEHRVQAEHLLRQMQETSIEVSTLTYSSMIEASGSDWVWALKSFYEMLQLNLEADAFICLALLSTSAVRSWQLGVCLLGHLRQPQDVTAHNVAVGVLGRADHWQLGTRCVQQLKFFGLRANIITRTSLLGMVQPARWPAAQDMLLSLHPSSLPPNASGPCV